MPIEMFSPCKVTQIAAIPANEENNLGVFALASDGTVWENYIIDGGRWGEWVRIPDLPQGGAR